MVEGYILEINKHYPDSLLPIYFQKKFYVRKQKPQSTTSYASLNLRQVGVKSEQVPPVRLKKLKTDMKSLSLENEYLKNMDIQAEKLQLIEWLARLNNTTTLKRFITLKKEQEKDWWDQLSTEEKSEIDEGLAQADRGEVVSHKEVMAKYKKWR